ncbi:growth-regulating factor 1 isoform X2 [Cannabis sativa]|uniref:growth-regulating factor 1 isoform X2 n=1 Tax=Cannabis sativa TaxID=3483 RepID=UPI0029C9F461|nr:growth-regulating factor 1 isoform X2 [Cannabis sativa]
MDFGLVSLESLVGPPSHHEGGGGNGGGGGGGCGGGASSQFNDSDTKSINNGVLGSGFVKQERSGPCDDDWKSSKVAKTVDLSSSKTMPLHQGSPMLRSNSLGFHADTRQQEHMLSFSSNKSQVSFLNKDAALVERTSQNSAFPFYQRPPTSYSRNTGYGSGSLNAGMHATFTGIRAPFTPSQWIELEHQALIYKYITSNVAVPSNLLMPLKKSLNPYGLAGSSAVSLPHNSWWGSFHLGFADNTDPEPGRCRRTDGKKWRCSRDAVADQKYCERHINRGRHRSRKPVEGQTGQAASGTTNSKVAQITTPVSTSVMPGGGGSASNNLAITQHQFKGLQSGAAVATNPSTDTLVNRMQDLRGAQSVMSSSNVNQKSNQTTFNVPKQVPAGGSSQSEFGLVSTDSLLNPSQENAYINSKNYASFLDFSGQEAQDQHHPLRHFIDDWPKDQSNRSVITWPEEMKSDWTQLSMSIPVTSSEFSSSTNSPTRQEKLALSPLRLSREFEPMQMNLGVNNDHFSEATHKQTNWVPKSWGSSMGGPLGEVLTNTAGSVKACKNPSSLNLLTEGWDGSPQLGSSPTGVLQKSTFCSLSNSSSGSSPRADNKRNIDGASVFDDVLGSTLASSSVPSL